MPNLRAMLAAWLMLAAIAGNAFAGPFEDAFAAYDTQDYATAYRLFRPLADSGSARAQTAVGIMYAKGQGVPQNNVEAVKWYRLAAPTEGTRRPNLLSRGCTKRAVVYRRAMLRQQAGIVVLPTSWAQTNLGVKYARGQGVPQDYITAYMWFDLSAAQGDQAAVSDRDAAARRMTPAQIAEAQKLVREWKPKKEEDRLTGAH